VTLRRVDPWWWLRAPLKLTPLTLTPLKLTPPLSALDPWCEDLRATTPEIRRQRYDSIKPSCISEHDRLGGSF